MEYNFFFIKAQLKIHYFCENNSLKFLSYSNTIKKKITNRLYNFYKSHAQIHYFCENDTCMRVLKWL